MARARSSGRGMRMMDARGLDREHANISSLGGCLQHAFEPSGQAAGSRSILVEIRSLGAMSKVPFVDCSGSNGKTISGARLVASRARWVLNSVHDARFERTDGGTAEDI